MKKLLAASSLLSVFLAGCGSQVSFDINMKNISEDTELQKAVIAVHGRNYNLNANQNEKIATAVREFLTSEDPSQLKQALFEAGAQKVLVVNDPIAPGKTVHFDFQYDPSISKGVYLTGYQKIDSSNYSYIGGLGVYSRVKKDLADFNYTAGNFQVSNTEVLESNTFDKSILRVQP